MLGTRRIALFHPTPGAAHASQWLGLKHVVVSHYVDPGCRDVQEFLEIAKRMDRGDGLAPRVTVMKPGETIVLG